ncbi:hypothetical protein YYC_04539 [Plasmodium yoelii 17X]|uniref:XTBD domain-containing protein n=4 Tax=Plasmodium yoelii TaxID=5861 RepID=A0AAF0B028_PLAYO|nr:XTBD domain-containing protein, putative [Plasmodium yoelii]EAA19287.1 hypothetical protein [Plasmodium yoelii yoelii]ETB57714.1 hypothetical protein YYC_04539 [Plasmodium yoelii 17X]WBY57357.1 XTBD domain-containing protein [Plasmodium yoelii yoelii]CDU18016.1 conserved Plasmodium protein, unknown function [Plasmodium yoelii]VTZ78433.1 XTBD domain-containing protein, putative [Plasmodium yoelii]|eukprot:XP_727722.1 XTBD domain-containing protein, putative [Plasmodium yoelii]
MKTENETNTANQNITEDEQAILVEANTRREWESHGQWLKRKYFLLKMLNYHKKNNIKLNVDKFSKMGHMYYNMKYLSCTYSDQIEQEIKIYEAEEFVE